MSRGLFTHTISPDTNGGDVTSLAAPLNFVDTSIGRPVQQTRYIKITQRGPVF